MPHSHDKGESRRGANSVASGGIAADRFQN
jgi:hypothetical protein